MNLLVQLHMIYTPIPRLDDLDPTKLILMNLSHAFIHISQYVLLQLVVKWCGFGDWIVCVSLCLMCYPMVAFFASIVVITELDTDMKYPIISSFSHAL